WKPSNPPGAPFFFVVLAGVLALIWLKRPAMHPVRWVLLCALLGLALLQVRHQAVLGIVAAVILPEAFAKGSVRAEAEERIWWLVGAAAVALIVVRLIMPMT